jgi:hypothetical protein
MSVIPDISVREQKDKCAAFPRSCPRRMASGRPVRQLLPHRLQRRRHAASDAADAIREVERLDEETTYTVDKMVGMRWHKGSRQYLVRWKGYAASADTWEPMENLVASLFVLAETKISPKLMI